jgi:hypothetical protein
MTTRAKQEWFRTASVAAALLVAVMVFKNPLQNAFAAGGSWDTDGILVNATETDRDRLVLLDTQKQRMLVYRCDAAGQFRLVNARCYKFDLELEDTSNVPEIEKRGGATFSRVYELFQAAKKKP